MSAFATVAILGVGLLGASVGAAARRAGVGRVVGYDVDPAQAKLARERKLVDACCESPAECVRDADLIVLAMPVPAMPESLRAAAPGLRPGMVVTDVGSVKGAVVESLTPFLPEGVHYVGSHPMAGGHRGGAENARDNLFDRAVVVVTGPASAARDRVSAFWGQLGAQVEYRSPGDHDLEVAWTSHLPHVLAFAFAGAFGEAPESAKRLAGAGFRDFTRIARSDPQLWAGILSANAPALLGPIARSVARLQELAAALESADGARLEMILAEARAELGDPPKS